MINIYSSNHSYYIGPLYFVDISGLNFDFTPIINILKSQDTYKLRCKKMSENFKPEQLPVFKGYIKLRKIGNCSLRKYINWNIFKKNFELEYRVIQKGGLKWIISQKSTRLIKTGLSEEDIYRFISFPRYHRESLTKIWVYEDGLVNSHMILALTRKKWIQEQIKKRKEKLPRN